MGFRKLVFEIEVLTDEDELAGQLARECRLHEIEWAIRTEPAPGPFSGRVRCVSNEELTGPQAARALAAQGAAPAFFNLTPEGEILD